jgi:hypothetical protein
MHPQACHGGEVGSFRTEALRPDRVAFCKVRGTPLQEGLRVCRERSLFAVLELELVLPSDQAKIR